MKKFLFAIATALTVVGASAQVGKAASEAADAAQHKIDEKRAANQAAKSGPVGKAVNNVKKGYHKKQAQRSGSKAKQAIKNAV